MPRLGALFLLLTLLLSACLPTQVGPASGPRTPAATLTTQAATPSASRLDSTPTNALPEIPTAEGYFLLPGELVLAASPDDIPALFASPELFVDAAAGDDEWDDQEEVIGVFINGEARAYPIRLLSLHEVVNDTVGEKAILVTWCPLCYSSLVFDRTLDRELTFGVSGYLFKNNLVMYDHQSNTLWGQILGQGLRGAYGGQRLELVSAVQTSWAAWKAEHPDTLVLSAQQMGRSEEFFDPYAGYYSSASAGLGSQSSLDARLGPKELVLGLAIGDKQKAYPFERIRTLGLLEDEINSTPILLVYNRALNSVEIYDRRLAGQVLTFEQGSTENILVDTETDSIWELDSGKARSGELAGQSLREIIAPIVFWFAWSDLHPETELYAE